MTARPGGSVRLGKIARLGGIAVGTLVVLGLLGWLLWPSPPAAAVLHGGTARYVVDATVDPPRMGDADITVDLAGRDGTAPDATGATVTVEAVMPLMGFATPALAATPGTHRHTVSRVPLMMTGPWELHVRITGRDGGTDDLTLPFTVAG